MENKQTRKLNTLFLWDKNPRTIDVDKFNSLKKKIKRWGQFKPLIITENGEVIGGNMRLRAYEEMGIEDVWVSVVYPKSEAEKIEIALADNELSGDWDELKLTELIAPFSDQIVLKDYELDLGRTTNLSDLFKSVSPDGTPNESEEYKEEYQVVVVCKNEGEQEQIYKNLLDQGYEVRVITV